VAKFPTRTELQVLPADKSARKIGWVIQENIGVGVVNPGGVTRMGITSFFYLFELFGFHVYYEEAEPSYYLTNEPLSVPASAHTAKPHAAYIFEPDGNILKDRYGNGTEIFDRVKDVLGVHQVMVS